MKYGALNQINAKVTSIKKGELLAQVSLKIVPPATMGSVMTIDSLNSLGIKEGDQVKLVIKGVNVLVVKES
jgi:molybdopterin-binding protein